MDPPPRSEPDLDMAAAEKLVAAALTPAEAVDESRGAWWEATGERATQGSTRWFGHYELLEEIAHGGMGVVYRARQQEAGRMVALKMILPHQLGSAGMVERFRGEAEAAASLDHPAILPIYEVGTEGGLPFFSMKFAEGGSLAARSKPFAPRKAATLMAAVARAVQHAHEHGILHRDLKPGNILLGAQDEPFVSDFGLAKWLERPSDLTLHQAVLGTPDYIAPEQASGRALALTTAADVYSLGTVLYELLGGRPPFSAPTGVETLRRVIDDSPPPLPGKTPRDLETICRKCLEKQPSERYASAAALADDLERFIAGRSIRARPASAPVQLARWFRRNPLAGSLASALVLALIAGTVTATLASFRIAAARDRAVLAERAATEELRSAYIAQARASRGSGKAGQRFDSLATLLKAEQIRPGVEIRNEAIAALALADLQVETTVAGARQRGTAPIMFDPASERYVTESEPGVIELRPLHGGGAVTRLTAQDKVPVTHFRPLSEDGRFLLSRHQQGGIVRVWDVISARLVFELKDRPTGGLTPFFAYDSAFRPDGKVVAIGLPTGGLSFHDLTNEGHELGRLTSAVAPACLAYDPSGTRLAMVGKAAKTVFVIDANDGHQLAELVHAGPVVHFAWSPDGRTLAVASADFNIYLWDVASGAQKQVLHGHREGVNQVAFHPAGDVLASTGRDRTIHLWDVRHGLPLVAISAQGAEPSLAFTRDGAHLFTGSYEIEPRVLRVAATPIWEVLRTASAVPSAAGLVCALDFSPDGRLMLCATRAAVNVLDAKSGEEAAAFAFDPGVEKAAAFDPRGNGLYLSSRASGTSRRSMRWQDERLEFGEPEVLDKTESFLLSGLRTDGAVFALSSRIRGETRLLSAEDPTRSPIVLPQPEVWQASLSPDGRWVATSSTGASGKPEALKIWAADTGTFERDLESIGPGGLAVFSPDGKRLAANGEKLSALFETGSWAPGPHLDPAAEKEGTTHCYSADGRMLAFYVTDRIYLFGAERGELLAVLEGPVPLGGVARLAFHPNGASLVAMGPDGAIQRWDLRALRAELQKLGLDW
jgi:WD40 repeat protein/predicted Ser/Thr protein kinase